jgi:hypothetical protein
MMMCITNTPFHPPPAFEDSRDYEDSGLDRAPNTTAFVHVSDWILALWIPRMKYVVTSRIALLLPLTSAMPPLSRCLFWGEKVLENYLVSHGVLKNHLNPPFLYRLGGLKNSTTIKQEPI